MVAERNESAAFNIRHQRLHVVFDRLAARAKLHLVETAHDVQLAMVFIQKFARMRASHHFIREQAVDAAFQEAVQQRADIAVAVAPPQVEKKSSVISGPFLKQMSSHDDA